MTTTPNIIFQQQGIGTDNGTYAIVKDVEIQKSDPEMIKLGEEIMKHVLQYTEADLDNEIVQGYHKQIALFTEKPLVHSGENWVKLLKKREKFIHINTAVDAYNIVVAKSFLGFGVHDLDKIKGDIVFDYAAEQETILPVNCDKPEKVAPGDFVYRDDEKILAWLDVKDSDLAKLDLDTKNIMLIVEGNENTTKEFNQQHIHMACELITKFCGGSYDIGFLSDHIA